MQPAAIRCGMGAEAICDGQRVAGTCDGQRVAGTCDGLRAVGARDGLRPAKIRSGRRAAAICAGGLVGFLGNAVLRADEFLALPGLWRTTYELEVSSLGDTGPMRVQWHCVDEQADPWVAFAQLEDLPGMQCARSGLERTSTSLKWRVRCRGPGPDSVADVIESTGAIVFDSPQHYTGWVRLNGYLMGYPLQSAAKIEGSRRAACTSPAD